MNYPTFYLGITAALSAVNGTTRVSVNENNTAASYNVSRHSPSTAHVMVNDSLFSENGN
jgi:hypothetical protein